MTESNQEEVGHFFRKLLKRDLGEWEKRVIALLACSKAYRNNDLSKLLEVANDMKTAHEAQISFIEKYAGDLFHPKPEKSLAMEREELNFLKKIIIPLLLKNLGKDSK